MLNGQNYVFQQTLYQLQSLHRELFQLVLCKFLCRQGIQDPRCMSKDKKVIKSNKQHGTDLLGDFNFQKNLFAATKEALMKLVIKIILILLTLSVCAFAVF